MKRKYCPYWKWCRKITRPSVTGTHCYCFARQKYNKTGKIEKAVINDMKKTARDFKKACAMKMYDE